MVLMRRMPAVPPRRFRPRLALQSIGLMTEGSAGTMTDADSARGDDRDRQNGRESVCFSIPQPMRRRSCSTIFRARCTNCSWSRKTGLAYVPIFGDGIHGRNPNPGHLLCIIDLVKRAHVGDIDLRPYIAPHTLKLGPDGLIYITCENSAVVAVIDRSTHKVVDAIDSGFDQRTSPDHFAGRSAALHRERGGRHGLGDRSAEAKAPAQDQNPARARRHRDFGRRSAPSSRSMTSSRRCS